MSSDYQHVTLAQVRPGMILSDELLDQQGQVLLPQGAILSTAMIALLPRHGIEMLAVLRNVGGEQPAAPDLAQVERRLARLFRKYDAGQNEIDHPGASASAALRRYIEDYRLERELAP